MQMRSLASSPSTNIRPGFWQAASAAHCTCPCGSEIAGNIGLSAGFSATVLLLCHPTVDVSEDPGFGLSELRVCNVPTTDLVQRLRHIHRRVELRQLSG